MKPSQSPPVEEAGATAIQTIVRHNVRLDRIIYRRLTELKTHHRKLRKRSAAAQAALQASVSSFGLVVPILVDRNGVIIDGEALVEAARAIGYTEVPVIVIDHLDEDEVRFLRIALNRLAELADWQQAELALEFEELLGLDIDLGCEVTGFTSIEIDNIVHAQADQEEDPDDVIEPLRDTSVSRAGDIWRLGKHRVLCGSSLEPANLARLMNDQFAQMVFTDSPYNLKILGHVSGLGKRKHREFAQASGEMSEAEFIDFQSRSTSALAQFCHDGALLYLCMDWRHVWEMMSGIRAAGLKLANIAVWVKQSGGMGSLYRSQHELIFIAKKGSAPSRNNVQLGRHGRNRTNCFFYPGLASFGAGRDEQLASHPTPKNVVMVADAIRDVSHRGEIVLDGFLGSGTTLIAAERTGRICYGVELDPIYVDGIIRRWEKATGNFATLEATGQTFADVSARRSQEPYIHRPEVVALPRKRVDACSVA